jgi:glycine cleavage system regulatory protein
MITLDLTPDEREHLVEVLTSALSDLRMEIANTDSQDFREMLKTRKLMLVKVLEAIGD